MAPPAGVFWKSTWASMSTDSSATAAEPHANRILIVDDDAELLALIGFALRNAGFQVVAANDGASALTIFEREPFALMILDIMMPGADGFAVCESVRTRSSMPVIMLSARNNEHDIVRALEIGADDYLTKPFSPRTLLARIHAVLRRIEVTSRATFETGGATLDVERHLLMFETTETQLTPLETLLLRELMTTPGRTVSTERLVTEAWGRSGAEERHALKQVIYRLRRKLETRTSIAGRLCTLRNAGYRWESGSEPPSFTDAS
jgi:DNA-binding response OmpR family regulator